MNRQIRWAQNKMRICLQKYLAEKDPVVKKRLGNNVEAWIDLVQKYLDEEIVKAMKGVKQ